MHARLTYFSLLFDAINCFSDRGSSTEIKVKHILAIEETLDLGFELGIESVEVVSKIPARRFCQLARAIQGGQRIKK